jgi:hypothetical protein
LYQIAYYFSVQEIHTMIHRKSILGFNAVAALVMIVASATTGTTFLDAKAQNADTSEQIRKYLIQAIQALDSGDNTEAIQQLQLATDRMGTFTTITEQTIDGQGNSDSQGNSDGQGTSDSQGTSDGESDDNGGESEEGSGEDADEPGDTDENDEED